MLLKPELTNYDIFPKVFPEHTEVTIKIKPLGIHAEFNRDEEYDIHIRPISEGNPYNYPNRPNFAEYSQKPDSDGGFTIKHRFDGEQEYFVRVMENGKRLLQLSVYALKEDLVGRYPYAGDLHMHTCRSDGREDPSVVAANYRKYGYDFLAITDHQRYYASLEAMRRFENAPTDYVLIPGEEVHLPDNDVHIVSFGGEYSINGLLNSRSQIKDRGTDPAERSLYGKCPPVMSDDEWKEKVNELLPTLDIPDSLPDKFTYAACVWIFNEIRKANGLGIFCHPYWISDVYQVPESLTDYITATKPFDAFEVSGGESYYEQNGFQWAKYYEDREKGRVYPIVGSTDSHGSVHNDNRLVARTIVFAKKNERTELIDSIKKMYSVAVETVGEEKIIGEFRLTKYACFLLKNYFPLHDELCFEEGRALKDYALGNNDAIGVLEVTKGRTVRMLKKYFAF